MDYSTRAIAAALLSLTVLNSVAHAADASVKAPAQPPDAPFFFVNDNRLTYAYQFTATSPGTTDKTAKQVFAYTHFDVWAYGTNFINLELLKSDRNDPASPCPIVGTGCAGATEFYGLIRSTFGWNQIFDTKAFSVRPLRNISFEVGADAETENQFLAPSRDPSSPVCSSHSTYHTKATSTLPRWPIRNGTTTLSQRHRSRLRILVSQMEIPASIQPGRSN